MRSIMVSLSEAGCICFRANVAKVRMEDGRWFDTGLPPGFSDIFGIAVDGRPMFVEVKGQGGRLRKEQAAFLAAMSGRGARAGVAYSIEDALQIACG